MSFDSSRWVWLASTSGEDAKAIFIAMQHARDWFRGASRIVAWLYCGIPEFVEHLVYFIVSFYCWTQLRSHLLAFWNLFASRGRGDGGDVNGACPYCSW